MAGFLRKKSKNNGNALPQPSTPSTSSSPSGSPLFYRFTSANSNSTSDTPLAQRVVSGPMSLAAVRRDSASFSSSRNHLPQPDNQRRRTTHTNPPPTAFTYETPQTDFSNAYQQRNPPHPLPAQQPLSPVTQDKPLPPTTDPFRRTTSLRAPQSSPFYADSRPLPTPNGVPLQPRLSLAGTNGNSYQQPRPIANQSTSTQPQLNLDFDPKGRQSPLIDLPPEIALYQEFSDALPPTPPDSFNSKPAGQPRYASGVPQILSPSSLPPISSSPLSPPKTHLGPVANQNRNNNPIASSSLSPSPSGNNNMGVNISTRHDLFSSASSPLKDFRVSLRSPRVAANSPFPTNNNNNNNNNNAQLPLQIQNEKQQTSLLPPIPQLSPRPPLHTAPVLVPVSPTASIDATKQKALPQVPPPEQMFNATASSMSPPPTTPRYTPPRPRTAPTFSPAMKGNKPLIFMARGGTSNTTSLPMAHHDASGGGRRSFDTVPLMSQIPETPDVQMRPIQKMAYPSPPPIEYSRPPQQRQLGPDQQRGMGSPLPARAVTLGNNGNRIGGITLTPSTPHSTPATLPPATTVPHPSSSLASFVPATPQTPSRTREASIKPRTQAAVQGEGQGQMARVVASSSTSTVMGHHVAGFGVSSQQVQQQQHHGNVTASGMAMPDVGFNNARSPLGNGHQMNGPNGGKGHVGGNSRPITPMLPLGNGTGHLNGNGNIEPALSSSPMVVLGSGSSLAAGFGGVEIAQDAPSAATAAGGGAGGGNGLGAPLFDGDPFAKPEGVKVVLSNSNKSSGSDRSKGRHKSKERNKSSASEQGPDVMGKASSGEVNGTLEDKPQTSSYVPLTPRSPEQAPNESPSRPLQTPPPPLVTETIAKVEADAAKETGVESFKSGGPGSVSLLNFVSNSELLKVLLEYLTFYDWCVLASVTREIRIVMVQKKEVREAILERFLKTVGYMRWVWENAEPLSLSLQDLSDYMRGVSTPTHDYARSANAYIQSLSIHPNHRDPAILDTVRTLTASTRAYTRVVLRLRAQAEKEVAVYNANLRKNASNRNGYGGSPARSNQPTSQVSSRAPSPTYSSFSHSHSQHHLPQAPPTSQPRQQQQQSGIMFRSPLFRLRRAPLLRVFVPSPEGDWLSDKSVLECEAECKRAGVMGLLRMGDVVWDIGVGDEGNVGRLVWDGSYLIDLDYTYSPTGELPKYMAALAFPPSYFHRVIRTGSTSSNPIVHMDLSIWGEEIAANLQLLQDRVRTETPQGAYHNVVRWVHRSSFMIRPPAKGVGGKVARIPIPGTDLSVDVGWYGMVVVETEGTNESLADLQERCGPGVFPPRVRGGHGAVSQGQVENRKVFRILREKSLIPLPSVSTLLSPPHPPLEDMHMGELPDRSPPDRSSNQPKELDNNELEVGKLYAVLTYRGDPASWNWGFFVPDPNSTPIGSSGTIFHVVNDQKTDEWKLKVETRDIVSWPLLVAVVRLADVAFLGGYDEIVGLDSLLPIFKTVAIPTECPTKKQQLSEFSSRMWFLDAVFSLHDCGVLQCDDVWLLEREIRKCAFWAMDKYLGNRGWTAYKAEKCSGITEH